ncbi:MAG: hypothetical protein K2G14_07115 [Ruminococcus sp.]|nr:hypothetical protein [Ruminococcus sp.]
MKKNNLVMNLTVAAAALTVIAVPTTLFIGSQLSASKVATQIETVSDDESAIVDSVDDEFVSQVSDTEVTITDGEDDGQVNEEIHQFTEDENYNDTIYALEYGWLPEDFEYNDEGTTYGGIFYNSTAEDGMTPMFIKIPKGVTYYEDTGNPEIATTKDEWLLDGKTVSMYYRSTYIPNNPKCNFGRIAFIYFDNTPYVLQLYVSDGISEEDFRKIIDNVKLVPSEKETAFLYIPLQEEDINTSDNESGLSGNQKVYQIGDDINIENDGDNHNISVKVDGVRFDKDFNTTAQDGLKYELYNCLNDKGLLDENGQLIDRVRYGVKYCNSVDSDYEELESETVPTSIMTAVLTYTNTGDTTIDNLINYDTRFYILTKRNDRFYHTPMANLFDIFGVYEDSDVSYHDNFDFFLKTEYGDCVFIKSANGFENIAPNESVQVVIALAVEDKFRDSLYLCMNENGFVDLSDIE